MGEETARKILESYRTWAVVGLSPRPHRPSHRVARFLQDRGYRVIPVNPLHDELLGERSYPDLTSIPSDEGVEVVDVFRHRDRAAPHVDEAIAVGATAVWLQLGVIVEDAAARARAAGLDVVMDRCPAIDYPRLIKP